MKAGEEEWSVNMKRGLVSLLQLDLLHLQSSAFISTEVHYLHYLPKPTKLFKAVIKTRGLQVACITPVHFVQSSN